MKPITIIGGGLAGLALGMLLRRENIPVAVIEAGRYPRHRVCGEFLSGRGREILQGLGLEGNLPTKVEAENCSFHIRNKRPIRFPLEHPALCVSRYELDATLANEFQRLGGILKTGERADLTIQTPGIVRATGRRRSSNATGRLFGLKAHARAAKGSSDLEMHFGDGQYVGVCKLAGGEVNVCGLFYSDQPKAIHDQWKELLENATFSQTLHSADWLEDSFCSVAGLTLDREPPADSFAIGDAAAMIPPLTGNGMSMAFESAALAHPILREFCSDEIDWAEAILAHNHAWEREFSHRLAWAAFLQRMSFNARGQKLFYFLVRSIPALPNLFFSRTR